MDSVKDKRRNTKLTKAVYKVTSKHCLTKSEDFVFTYDCVKAVTLYWEKNQTRLLLLLRVCI